MSKRMVEQECCDVGECSKQREQSCGACGIDTCRTHGCLVGDNSGSSYIASWSSSGSFEVWLCLKDFEELKERYRVKGKAQEAP